MAKKKSKQDDATQQMINLQAAQLAAQVAQNAAQQEFQRMRFDELEKPQFSHLTEMDKEQLAFQKAQQAFQEAFQTASMTGMWNGQQTIAEQQRQLQNQMTQAGLTGQYNGQDTAEERQRKIANLMAEAGITGTYNGQKTAAQQAAEFAQGISAAGLTGQYNGQQTVDWQARQAGLTGYFNGQDTLQRQQMQNENALALLNLQSSLRGPRNAFQYANMISSTPQGLQGELQAMLGRAQLPASAGYQGGMPLPANIGSMAGAYQQPYAPAGMSPVVPSGAALAPGYNEGPALPVNPITPGTGAGIGVGVPDVERQATLATTQAAAPFSLSGMNEQAPANLYNYQPTGDGRYYSYPPGMMAPPEATQYNSSVPMNQSEIKKFEDSLPLGSQISASYWNKAPQYTKDVMMSGYENRGDDPAYIEEQYKRSLPKYTGAAVGSFI